MSKRKHAATSRKSHTAGLAGSQELLDKTGTKPTRSAPSWAKGQGVHSHALTRGDCGGLVASFHIPFPEDAVSRYRNYSRNLNVRCGADPDEIDCQMFRNTIWWPFKPLKRSDRLSVD